MKKIIFVVIMLLSLPCVKAQDVERINGFVKELMALEGEHVKCEIAGFDSFLDDIVTAQFNGQKMDLSSIRERLGNAEWKFVAVMADDKEGYDAIYEILDNPNSCSRTVRLPPRQGTLCSYNTPAPLLTPPELLQDKPPAVPSPSYMQNVERFRGRMQLPDIGVQPTEG